MIKARSYWLVVGKEHIKNAAMPIHVFRSRARIENKMTGTPTRGSIQSISLVSCCDGASSLATDLQNIMGGFNTCKPYDRSRYCGPGVIHTAKMGSGRTIGWWE